MIPRRAGALRATVLVGFALASFACVHDARPPAAGEAAATCKPPRATKARLTVVVLGSGGPRSFGRGASGYVLLVDGTPRILVDAGPGAFLRLGELQLDLSALDTVLLTHLHIDHSGDLPGFVKARDLSMDVPVRFRVVGPAGANVYPSTSAFVDRLFGPTGAFAYLKTFRNALSFDVVDLPVAQDAPAREVFHEGELRVTTIPVDHGDVPAAAFRIELAGHAVVVSGDLASKNDNLARLAAGADVLVYDTTVLDPPGSPAPLYDLHTTPRRIGEIASMAHVRSVVLSHIPPSVDHDRRAVLGSIRASYGGDVHFAEDCEVLEVPSP